MADIIVKKVRTTQPQQAVGIDWSNPITRGLVASSSPNTRTYTNGGVVLPSVTGAGSIRHADNEVFRQSVAQTAMPALKNAPSTTSSLTFLSVFIPGNEVTERATGQLGQISSGFRAGIVVGDGTTAGVVRFKVTLGGTVGYSGGTQADFTRQNVAIGRHINATAQELWLNGIKSATTGSLTGSSLGYAFYGHSISSGLTALALNVVWNRALTDAEIKSLSDNPWQIFTPEKRIISFDDVVTGGGGSVDLVGSNSTQNNTSSSGAITQTHRLISYSVTQNKSTSNVSTTQKHILAAQNNSQNKDVSSGLVTQIHIAIGSNSIKNSTTNTGFTSNIHDVVAVNTAKNNISSVGIVLQIHILSSQNTVKSNLVSANLVAAISINATSTVRAKQFALSSISQRHNIIAQNSNHYKFIISDGSTNKIFKIRNSRMRHIFNNQYY